MAKPKSAMGEGVRREVAEFEGAGKGAGSATALSSAGAWPAGEFNGWAAAAGRCRDWMR